MRYQTRLLQQREVLVCSLRYLVVIYGLASILALLVRIFPKYNEEIFKQSWLPFTFFASTMIWVVLSRVIGNIGKNILFSIWILTLLGGVTWAASHEKHGTAMALGAISIAVTFGVVSIMINHFPMRRIFVDLYTVIAIFVSLGLFVLAPYIPGINGSWSDMIFILVSIVAALLCIYQLWNLWHYVTVNKHPTLISNTCMFAVMSPWSETVDTFSVLSRY